MTSSFSGPGGQRICHVREEPLQIPTPLNPDYMTSILSDPRFQFDLPTNTHTDLLNRLYSDRVHVRKRRERLLPPIPGWSPSGTVSSNFRFDLIDEFSLIYF